MHILRRELHPDFLCGLKDDARLSGNPFKTNGVFFSKFLQTLPAFRRGIGNETKSLFSRINVIHGHFF